MKLLLIGSGGREHPLAWKLAKSEKVEKIFVAPGNGGTAIENKCENVDITDINELLTFAKENNIDLTNITFKMVYLLITIGLVAGILLIIQYRML